MSAEQRLKRGDVAFFNRVVQLSVERWYLSDRVEVCLRSCKGDHLRKGKIVTRVHNHAPQVFKAEGGAVDLRIELFFCLHITLSCPFSCFRCRREQLDHADEASGGVYAAAGGAVGGTAAF